MMTLNETNIILAIIGMVGLLSTFTIIARTRSISARYYGKR